MRTDKFIKHAALFAIASTIFASPANTETTQTMATLNRADIPVLQEQAAKAEAIAYVKRWRIVNEYERTELRRTPMARKLQQLASLMASAALSRPCSFALTVSKRPVP